MPSFSVSYIKKNSLTLSTIYEPTTYDEAVRNENWKQAIQTKFSALMKTNTWELIHVPPNKKVVGCKWVFKLKLNADGSVEIYKADLFINGFTQTEGLDYLDTLSPMVKVTNVWVILALAASNNWFLYQLDINKASFPSW